MPNNFIVDQSKLRLDRFLADQQLGISRSKIQKDIEAGQVKVNGKQIFEGKFVVREGDKIEYEVIEQPKIEAKELDIDVLYENDDILIVNKPAGLVVHPAPGYNGPTLAEGLLYRYKEIKVIGEDEVRPGIVHRLDKDTSGVMLVAKSQRMFEHLKGSFAERLVKKEYLALACGKVQPTHGSINSPIGRHSTDFRKMTTHLPKDPKPALTEYKVLKYLTTPSTANGLASVDEYSLIRVKLHTGRTHQIRVHFSSLGHPLAGDTLYGKCKAPELHRQFLHAAKIEVELMDGTWIEAEAPLPADLQNVLNNLKEI